MYCENCGQEIDNKAKFCPECGASVTNNKPKKKKKEKVKKPFYKRWWFWFIVVFILIGALGGGESSEETVDPVSESTVASTTNNLKTLDDAFVSMQNAIADTEESTTARVDEIARIAKADAASITDHLGNEACEYIVEHYPDFYTDNEKMEKIMYCGFLLEYGYKGETASNLGQDVTQAVKYVYRGAESVEDDATQENLRQIEEVLIEAGLLSQESTKPADTASPAANSEASVGEKNALRSAISYLDFSAFSYSGLIEQLEYEGYTAEEATYAVDNCGADWSEQALLSAKNYLDFSAFSYSGLIDQLKYEGFTTEEATYGVDNCGADWFEQAAKCAQNYLEYSSFSRAGLIDQLKYEGFTNEQAVYGVDPAGL